jgi:hypothetical protein
MSVLLISMACSTFSRAASPHPVQPQLDPLSCDLVESGSSVGICSNRSFGEASMSTMTKQFWNDGYIVLRGIFEPAYMNEFPR